MNIEQWPKFFFARNINVFETLNLLKMSFKWTKTMQGVYQEYPVYRYVDAFCLSIAKCCSRPCSPLKCWNIKSEQTSHVRIFTFKLKRNAEGNANNEREFVDVHLTLINRYELTRYKEPSSIDRATSFPVFVCDPAGVSVYKAGSHGILQLQDSSTSSMREVLLLSLGTMS